MSFSNRGSVKDHQLDRYLREGYAVVSIDHRLAPETKLPEIVADLQDACRWVREEEPRLFHIEAERIAVVGNSAGGYLTLMAGQRPASPSRARVLLRLRRYQRDVSARSRRNTTICWTSSPTGGRPRVRPPSSKPEGPRGVR